jgi:hypothetical protein
MSSKEKSAKQIERELVIARTRFSIGDRDLAEEIGRCFGGNGYSHDDQVLLAADLIRKYRESLR